VGTDVTKTPRLVVFKLGRIVQVGFTKSDLVSDGPELEAGDNVEETIRPEATESEPELQTGLGI